MPPSNDIPWTGTTRPQSPLAAQAPDYSSSDDSFAQETNDDINRYLIRPIINNGVVLPHVVCTTVDVSPDQIRRVYLHLYIQMLSGTRANEFKVKIGDNRRSLEIEDQVGVSKSIFYSDVAWKEIESDHTSKQIQAAFNIVTDSFMTPPKQSMTIHTKVPLRTIVSKKAWNQNFSCGPGERKESVKICQITCEVDFQDKQFQTDVEMEEREFQSPSKFGSFIGASKPKAATAGASFAEKSIQELVKHMAKLKSVEKSPTSAPHSEEEDNESLLSFDTAALIQGGKKKMKQGNPDHCKKSSSSTSKQKMFETLLTDLISHDSSYEE